MALCHIENTAVKVYKTYTTALSIAKKKKKFLLKDLLAFRMAFWSQSQSIFYRVMTK